jgi:hypothetical protein
MTAETTVVSIDARCGCARCEARTTDTYRMIGKCWNCQTDNIVILYRAGDRAAPKDCPVCGVWHEVRPYRLATEDEVPVL